MLLVDLDDELDELADREEDLWSPEVYLRIGSYMAPLRSIKYIPEDENHEEAIIFQADDYDDDLM